MSKDLELHPIKLSQSPPPSFVDLIKGLRWGVSLEDALMIFRKILEWLR